MLAGGLGDGGCCCRHGLVARPASEGGTPASPWNGTEEMEAVTLEMQRARFPWRGGTVHRYPRRAPGAPVLGSAPAYDWRTRRDGGAWRRVAGSATGSASGRVLREKGRGRVASHRMDGYEEWGVRAVRDRAAEGTAGDIIRSSVTQT